MLIKLNQASGNHQMDVQWVAYPSAFSMSSEFADLFELWVRR